MNTSGEKVDPLANYGYVSKAIANNRLVVEQCVRPDIKTTNDAIKILDETKLKRIFFIVHLDKEVPMITFRDPAEKFFRTLPLT